jgi:hypothetical protein
MKSALLKSSCKYGLIMGIGFCSYTTLMWLTKLDTAYLSFGQYVDVAIIIWPIVIILRAIREARDLYQITILKRVLIALFVGTISYLIYAPFLYIYHHYINPEWYNYVLQLKEMELKAAHVSQDKIVDTLQQMSRSNIAQSGIFRLSALIPSVIIIPILIALISVIFIKNKKNQSAKL